MFSGKTFMVVFETAKTAKVSPIETYPLYGPVYSRIFTKLRIHISIVQGETDTQLQQPMEHTVVDNSKKENEKGDKQQSVSINSQSMNCICIAAYVTIK